MYDLCGMYTLDRIGKEVKPSSPAAMGLGGIAAGSSASTGFVSSPLTASPIGEQSGSGKAGQMSDEEAFSRKAVFVRQVLGQLRWVLDEEPHHPTGIAVEPHLIVLCEILLKALVVEAIIVRICEYMVRAEPVWRSFGFERKKVDGRAFLRQEVFAPEEVRFSYRRMSPTYEDLYHVPAKR
jgi:hypothetical protein